MNKFVVVIGALVLAAAACGGGDDIATGDLPPADGGGVQAAESTCLAGEPDCTDIPGAEGAQELPNGGDAVDSGGMVVDGGLTVAEALATEATGVLAVKGFVVATADEVRLCDVLLESYPPQCGGDSVVLDSLDAIDPDSLANEGAVSWTDSPQTVFGELSDGVLATTAMSR